MDKQQPWLNSIWSDIIFILSPPFVSLLLVFAFPSHFQQSIGMPIVYWVILVVFIDVAHVYSTLYRTYFNHGNFKRNSTLLLIIPLSCYLFGVIVYQYDALWFWRILAYLAVFHFIRQQYGFMSLYSRQERSSKWIKYIDILTIYTATIYPLLYWHLSANRNFNWFIAGDFMLFKNNWLMKWSSILYMLILLLYIIKEIYIIIKKKRFNIPKNLLIIGTSLSWYFGIIYFNGDIAFTTLNVISHGIPYMALIWFFEKKKIDQVKLNQNKLMKLSFGKFGILYFLLILIAFAYFEEGLWDGLIWKEHQQIFKLFSFLPQLTDQIIISLLIPLLALPQATHYVLDGFIWKKKHQF
ncbi:hypothetical protein [Pedobacter frigiditerrae]|uniref:hypothetical protein n=1 Tax=Pedobacter frigiditerrae TaxID=2530452 RepID=UPI00292E732E|nr:hypothetical protein [Pedobacter frigiditerrae]